MIWDIIFYTYMGVGALGWVVIATLLVDAVHRRLRTTYHQRKRNSYLRRYR